MTSGTDEAGEALIKDADAKSKSPARSRRRRAASTALDHVLPRSARIVFVVWIALVVISVVFGRDRMLRESARVPMGQILNRVANAAGGLRCRRPDDPDAICAKLYPDQAMTNESKGIYVLGEGGGWCATAPSGRHCLGLLENNLFRDREDCERHCRWGWGPEGFYLTLFAFLLSLALILSVLTLPLDRDKPRLRRALASWLRWTMAGIALSLSLSLTGAVLMIHAEISSEWEEGSKLDLSLALAPLVSLCFPIYFWKSVYRLYDSLDVSKQVLSGVWSSKI